MNKNSANENPGKSRPARPDRASAQKTPMRPPARERRASDRLRNIEVKGWYKEISTAAGELSRNPEKEQEVKGWYKEMSTAAGPEKSLRASFALIPTRVVDISPTGVSIRSTKPMKPGQNLYLNIKLCEGAGAEEGMLKVSCEVIRCRSAQAEDETDDQPWGDVYIVGLKFLELSGEQKKLIEEFLKSNK